MRFSTASGTDNSLLQTIANSNADIELHTHEIDNHTRPYGVEGKVTIQPFFSGTGVAPHGSALRTTYTCPADKIARIDSISLLLWRKTVAGTNGVVEMLASYDNDGSTAVAILNIAIFTNAIGDRAMANISPKIFLDEGDAFHFFTLDLSTTGTIDYRGHAFITEVDV